MKSIDKARQVARTYVKAIPDVVVELGFFEPRIYCWVFPVTRKGRIVGRICVDCYTGTIRHSRTTAVEVLHGDV